MSIELAYKNIEQAAAATPMTDKVLDLAMSKMPNMTSVDRLPILSGLRMVGVGFAEVQTRYDGNRVEDGAMAILHEKYLAKTMLHIPEQVHSELTPDDFEEILEEQAELARSQAEMNIILAPDIAMVSADTINPTAESLQMQKIKILENAVEEQRHQISARDETIRRQERMIAGLRTRLGEENSAGRTHPEIERSASQSRELGSATLHAIDFTVR